MRQRTGGGEVAGADVYSGIAGEIGAAIEDGAGK
jgi:hypothetical protein